MFQLIQKFKRWIAPKPRLPIALPLTDVQQAAADLVERARNYDQVAIATIVATANEAKAGNPKSKKGLEYILAYGRKNPIREYVSFGDELQAAAQSDVLAKKVSDAMATDYLKAIFDEVPPLAMQSVHKAIVTVADGPILMVEGQPDSLLSQIAAALPPDQSRVFMTAVKRCEKSMKLMKALPPDYHKALMVGIILGKACKLQAVRNGASISLICPVAAWELGE
jgi:hypothetical protein